MKNNLSKILILIIPIILFAGNFTKADTFDLTFEDPGTFVYSCYDNSGVDSAGGGEPCTDLVTLPLTVNLNSGGYSNGAIYPYSNFSTPFSYDTLDITVNNKGMVGIGQTDGDQFSTCGNNGSKSLGYGGVLNLSYFSVYCGVIGNISQSQTYDLAWTFSINLMTKENNFYPTYSSFPNFVVHDQIFIPKVSVPVNKPPTILVK
ncbi:MAG: hypothetical protein WCO35_02880 [Candidatus Nomurabacteria bacterium]